jgi:putative methyltransferase (TIGR04325 family)
LSFSLRSLLRNLAPHGVIHARQQRRDAALSSWQAACDAAGGYDAERVNRFRVERSAQPGAQKTELNSSLLPLVMRLIGRHDVSITDFGGATGGLGEAFLFAFPQAHYTVVEVPALVAMMQGLSAVAFTTGMPAVCDIFLTSGTLQYLDAPMQMLERGFASARHAVILARNSFAEAEAFHLQRTRLFDNGSGPVPPGYEDCEFTFAHRSIAESAVMRLAKAYGFECLARLEEHSGTLFGPYGPEYGKHLLFWKS